jgi:hypothetical protein
VPSVISRPLHAPIHSCIRLTFDRPSIPAYIGLCSLVRPFNYAVKRKQLFILLK